MAVAGALRKRGTVAGPQHGLAAVLDQCQFSLEHVDKFVFVAVPVALTGPAAGRQRHQVHPEIAQTAGIAQAPPRAGCARRIERRWITGPLEDADGGDVDSWHEDSSVTDARTRRNSSRIVGSGDRPGEIDRRPAVLQPIQLRGPVRAFSLAGYFFEQVAGEHPAAKGFLLEGPAEHSLVHTLQL